MRSLPLLVACLVAALAGGGLAARPHIVVIVADDLGYNDLGIRNAREHGPRTITPTIDGLISSGITLSSYYTFKICSPSRASTLTGRYPWGAGFYSMNVDNDHTTTNFTLYPQLLAEAGYRTHALGKWDVGYLVRNATATYRGFEDFYGYYGACNSDYWYHTAGNGGSDCTPQGTFNTSIVDWSDSVGSHVGPVDREAANGTYNRHLLSDRAVSIINAHNASESLYMYLAFQNVHEGCSRPDKLGVQAPLATVQLYAKTELDTYKIQGAMLTELDDGVQAVIQALQARSFWENTLLVFVADNGGPLDHSTNAPLRGGKHTFWEGGVRVEAFLAGGILPNSLRNTTWGGMAHASDWYLTLTEGVAGITVDPAQTGGPRPLDGFNLWPSILSQGASPRNEVVHQVNNSYFDEGVSAIRIGDLKLIRGAVGDKRIIGWPERSHVEVPLGKSGAVIEPGTDHVRGTTLPGQVHHKCDPYCLFNVTADISESTDLAHEPGYRSIAQKMSERLDEVGRTGPPNAYIWPDRNKLKEVTRSLCPRILATGTIQPVDW